MVLMGLAGCASGGGQEPQPVATESDVKVAEPSPLVDEAPSAAVQADAAAEELELLYSQMDSSVAEYEGGLELIQAGEEWLGEEKLRLSSAKILSGAGLCGALPGCDISRFLDSYDRLLSLQGAIMKQQRAGARGDDLVTESVQESEGLETEAVPSDQEVPAVNGTASLLGGSELRDLITLNTPINAALDDWLTWMRPDLMTAYRNYQFLRPKIAPIYEDAGLPEALLFAMIATESRGKVHAVSRAGAAGPLQFMRYTGRRYGLTEVDGFDLRYDPEAATRANVAYISYYLKKYDNSLEKVLAAYNGGESRMNSLQRRYGKTSYWDHRVLYSFPRETREYVPRVLAAAWLFLDPAAYNLDFPAFDVATVPITVQQEISVGELAICLGQEGSDDGWFRTLRNQNPKLGPDERVAVGKTVEIPAALKPLYDERCLGGELMARARTIHDANYPEKPPMIRYTVRAGDTLSRIASRHSCASLREIAAINRIRAPRYVIRTGQRLQVPACS
jgi:membrane-bound lytic murein transglycosylase D